MTELEKLISRFGAYVCQYCRDGQHEHCAGHGGRWGEPCRCKMRGHDLNSALSVALEAGKQRMEALSH